MSFACAQSGAAQSRNASSPQTQVCWNHARVALDSYTCGRGLSGQSTQPCVDVDMTCVAEGMAWVLGDAAGRGRVMCDNVVAAWAERRASTCKGLGRDLLGCSVMRRYSCGCSGQAWKGVRRAWGGGAGHGATVVSNPGRCTINDTQVC